jgi:hypothetical protein
MILQRSHARESRFAESRNPKSILQENHRLPRTFRQNQSLKISASINPINGLRILHGRLIEGSGGAVDIACAGESDQAIAQVLPVKLKMTISITMPTCVIG